jgi:hypothetical protein
VGDTIEERSLSSMFHHSRHTAFRTVAIVALVLLPVIASAQSAAGTKTTSAPLPISSFKDLPVNSPAWAAAEYLKSKGIIQGDTFKPNDKLTRAQAVKVLVAPLVSADQLKTIKASSFSDVAADAWYMPYAEAAKVIGIIDASSTFSPNKPVTKAGFIKMILVAKKIDAVKMYGDFKDPLSSDVKNPTDWFYAPMRYAIASSMTAVGGDGLLSPARELTRGEMAILYYRLDMYIAGRRTQALLSQAETDIGNVLQMLDQKNIDQAEYASSRAVLASLGALVIRPNEGIVKGAVKISEGFRKIVAAYRAGTSGNLDLAISNAKDAYALADKAKAFSPNLSFVASQMQTIAKSMADEARKVKAQPAVSAPASSAKAK